MSHKTWGTLACATSKIELLRLQVRHGWPFLMLLEDDVRITKASFVSHVYDWSRRMDNLSLVRFARWTARRDSAAERWSPRHA